MLVLLILSCLEVRRPTDISAIKELIDLFIYLHIINQHCDAIVC